MAALAASRRYKELRFQQLRSFAETARLGSLAAPPLPWALLSLPSGRRYMSWSGR